MKWLYTVQFQLHDTLEKAKLRSKKISGCQGLWGGENVQAAQRGFLGL